MYGEGEGVEGLDIEMGLRPYGEPAGRATWMANGGVNARSVFQESLFW